MGLAGDMALNGLDGVKPRERDRKKLRGPYTAVVFGRDKPVDIEPNVPMPRRNPHNTPLYPFADMKVGDSFAVKVPDGMTPAECSHVVRQAAYRFRRTKSNGFTFSTRTMTSPDGVVVRVWRTSPVEVAGA